MLPDNPSAWPASDLAEIDEAVLPFAGGRMSGQTALAGRSSATTCLNAVNDYSALARRADEAATLLRVLGNESRLTIFQLLVDRPMTVGEISLHTSRPQNDVSMNLEKLRKASLVKFKRNGRFRYYFIPDNGPTYLVLSILQKFEVARR